MTPRSSVTEGTIVHRRFRDVERRFRYSGFHLLVDVDELDGLAATVGGFGRGRAISVRARDHFGPDDLPLRTKLERWVRSVGGTLGDGPLLLWTYPAMLGHVFNPVSWWFSYDEDGELRLAVAEVNNTFGDSHAYLLDDLATSAQGVVTASAEKVLHVSPFLPIDGLTYHFTFRPPALDDRGAPVAATIRVVDGAGRRVFDATQTGKPRPLTTQSLWSTVVRHPMVSLVALGRIHWQAIKLWLRRAPFFRRPAPRTVHDSEQQASTGPTGATA